MMIDKRLNFKIQALIDCRVKFKWTSKVSMWRRGLPIQIRSTSLAERNKQDTKEITEFV